MKFSIQKYILALRRKVSLLRFYQFNLHRKLFIVPGFVDNIQQDKEAGRQTDRQPEDVDKGKCLVPKQVPESELEIISNHYGSFFVYFFSFLVSRQSLPRKLRSVGCQFLTHSLSWSPDSSGRR